LTFKGIHDVTAQKIEIFIPTAVGTENPTNFVLHSSDIIRPIISMSTRWTTHAISIKEMRNEHIILDEDVKERKYFGNLVVENRVILKFM
jgi:homoserine acetyltransferase